MTLQKLLKAYEVVLPRHGARPEEDIYYYRCGGGQGGRAHAQACVREAAALTLPPAHPRRLLLKLSLDPDPDWWSKYRRETGQEAPKA